jgi:hypothetical protein
MMKACIQMMNLMKEDKPAKIILDNLKKYYTLIAVIQNRTII